MPVEPENRERVRSLLQRANVEINSALNRVDSMGEYELAEAAGAGEATRAFFDFNGSCGATDLASGRTELASPTRTNPKAFFDFNGSCGGSVLTNTSISDAQRGAALVRALRDVVR